MILKLFFALLLAFETEVLGQISRKGPCPNYTVPVNYNHEDFKGRWYEFAKTPRLLEPFTKCVYFEYSSLRSNNKITIRTNQRSPITGLKLTSSVDVTPSEPGAWKSISGYEHRIYATDNNRFAVIHACKNGLLGSSEMLWILTRDKLPRYATVFEAQYYIFFDMQRYSLRGLKVTNQRACPKKDDALLG